MTLWTKLQLALGVERAVDAAKDAAKEAGVDAKSIFTSKTFLFNLAAGVIGVLQAQGVFTLIPDPYGPAVVAVANLLLRYVTTSPVRVLPAG